MRIHYYVMNDALRSKLKFPMPTNTSSSSEQNKKNDFFQFTQFRFQIKPNSRFNLQTKLKKCEQIIGGGRRMRNNEEKKKNTTQQRSIEEFLYVKRILELDQTKNFYLRAHGLWLIGWNGFFWLYFLFISTDSIPMPASLSSEHISLTSLVLLSLFIPLSLFILSSFCCLKIMMKLNNTASKNIKQSLRIYHARWTWTKTCKKKKIQQTVRPTNNEHRNIKCTAKT